MVQVNTFDGGLATRVHESLLNVNQAHELVNVDPNSAVLTSAPAFIPIGQTASNFIYSFRERDELDYTWRSFSSAIDAVEYEGRLIYTQEGQPARVWFDGAQHKLGVDKPGEAQDRVVATVDSTNTGASEYRRVTFAHSVAVKAGNPDAADISYRVAFFAENGCQIGENVDFTNRVPQGEHLLIIYSATGYEARLYRLVGETYYLVSENGPTNFILVDSYRDLDQPVEGNKTYEVQTTNDDTGTVSYTATFFDETTGYESAPMTFSTDLEVNCANHIRVDGWPARPANTSVKVYRRGPPQAGVTRVQYLGKTTQNAYYDYNPYSYGGEELEANGYVPPEDKMHSLVEVYGTFFGIVDDKLVWSENDKPYAWPPSQNLRLREPGTGLLVVPQGLLVFTRNFTYILTGTDLSDFNLSIVSTNQGCLSNRSCQLVKNSPVWVSHDGICSLANGYAQVLSRPILGRISLDVQQTIVFDEQYYVLETNGNILVLDLRSNLRFYRLKPTQKFTDLHVYNGALYASDGSQIYDIGSEPLEMTYVSPVFIEGNHTVEKNYNQLFFRSDGEFTVELLIDGYTVATDRLSGNKAHIITPPSGQSKGTSSQVKITGTGTVYAFDTQPSGEREGGIQ